jgi:ADP-heptose:LPS heptosyltransferase
VIKSQSKSSVGDIALFRLDGFGGSITLTDQATKIFNRTGIKPTLVIRNNKDIFLGHPHIKQVIEVGYVNWGESLREVLKGFDTVAEIRFGLGKWHQSGKKIFDQDFGQLQGIFDQFPKNYNQFEIHNLHHIQLTDKTLGLPFEDIQSKIYHFEDIKNFNLPNEYILMSNGVDVQHQGMKQTKTWDYWNDLVQLIDLPVIQIGTQYDRLINSKTIDLRNKTNMGELAQIVKSAKGVICTEGGIMHLAYAVESPNVFVLRGPTRGKLFEYPKHHFIDSYICDNCWSTTDDWFVKCPKECDAVCMKSITPERVAYNLERVLHENMVTDIRI